MTSCAFCGKCCYLVVNKRLKRCRHMVKLTHDRSLCRIYNHRLGKGIGHGHTCISRMEDDWDYPDCPFNCGKPVHPYWLNGKEEKKSELYNED